MILLVYGICILLLLIGTITDLRIREVPDWANYAGIFAGLGIRLIWSLHSFEWSFIIEGLIGFGVFFGLACLMFYAGQWGGGDSKMLMALGALLGMKFSVSHIAVAFLVWVVVVGGAYGLVWSIGLALRNWKKFRKAFAELRCGLNFIRAKKLVLFAMVLLFIIAIFAGDAVLRILILLPAVLAGLMFYAILFVKSVEKCCMFMYVKPEQLTEGDWIAKDIKVNGERVCGPKDLGIDKKQIKQLIKAKLEKVLIKVGIPFVPSFLIAFVLALWVGNPLILLI